MPTVTKEELLRQTKVLCAEAWRIDADRMDAAAVQLFGGAVFAWDLATVRQIRSLRVVAFAVRLGGA